MAKKAYLEAYKNIEYNTWASYIKQIWRYGDMENVWLNQGTKYKTKIIRLLKMNLTTKYDNSWEAIMNKEDSKLRTYKQF